jgi:Protein of unknown function (DUF3991)/Toprim-like
MTDWGRRNEADRLRGLPLEAVLRSLGAEPDRHDKSKWHTPAGTLSVSGAKFMNWSRGIGGGGAIDLVIQVKNLGFIDAIDWLARKVAGAVPLEPAVSTPAPAWRLPPADSSHLHGVRSYLADQRRIATTTIDALIRSGTLYSDARANAVFLLLGKDNIPVGAELRGTTGCSWRGMAPGSRKDSGFFSIPASSTPSVVLCESAIDAISCCALHPHCRCISTAGARPNPAWLPLLIAHASEVHCGFDADPTGDDMAAAMISRHPSIKRLRPSLHDWNDVLRSQS